MAVQTTFGQTVRELVVKIDESYEGGLCASDLQAMDDNHKIQSIKQKFGISTLGKSVLDGIYKIEVPSDMDYQTVCDSLLKLPNVKYAEPVHQESLLLIPNDPDAQFAANQPYLEVIKAYDAWEISQSNDNIIIGISDAGTDMDHIELVGKFFPNDDIPGDNLDNDGNGYIDDFFGYDFADSDADPNSDLDPHGTQVAGVAAASTDNGIGIAGVGFDARISSLKIFRSSNNFSNNAYESVLYAANNGFDIINLSWGSTGSYSQYNQDIIEYAVVEKNLIVTAAAGNTPIDIEFYPASYEYVLSVAATNLDDTKSGFSTYSRHVDLTAPGTSVYSTYDGDTYFSESGTSFSAPMVAGTAALVKDIYPNLNAQQVMERIRVTSDDIYNVGSNGNYRGKLGYGRLNALKALNESNVKSIRADEPLLSTTFDGVFFGDTVNISTKLTNYLDPVIQPEITIEVISGNASVLTAGKELNFMNTLSTQQVNQLQILVDESASPGATVEYLLKYESENYKDEQLFEFDLNPDYFDFGNDNSSITLSGDGDLGFASDGFQNGVGWQWQENQLVKEIGFFAILDSVVLDNVTIDYSSGTREQDFQTITPTRPFMYNEGALAYHEFKDQSDQIRVEQSTFIPESVDDVVIIDYRLINLLSDSIFNLRLGIFDDLHFSEDESKATTEDNNTAFGINQAENIFAGIRVISNDSTFSSILDLSDIQGSLTTYNDSAKLAWTEANLGDSIGFDMAKDIAAIQGTFLDTLIPNQFTQTAFILAAAPTKSQLIAKFDAAESEVNSLRENPLVIESFISCEGGNVTLDPSNGNQFYFFSDPLAQDTISYGTSLSVGPINNDSVFYISNADESYSGAVKALQVLLKSEIADFSIPDTLFLGATSSLEIVDKSFDPTSWSWDFGNGIQASGIQNPSVNYGEVGTYTITLDVTTIQGCQDTKSRNLIVINAIEQPEISDLFACPDQTLQVASTTSEYLKHYYSESANLPLAQGTQINISGIKSDTVVYFSRVVNGIESKIGSYTVTLSTPETEFISTPHVDSDGKNSVVLSPIEKSIASIVWKVDGEQIGDSTLASFAITSSTHAVEMNLTTSSGCVVQTTETLDFTTSSIPSLEDQIACLGSSVSVTPSNGEVFGFYTDSTLTQLLGVGSEFVLDSIKTDTSIFIVGLTDFLPSEPVEHRISVEEYEFEISASETEIFLEESGKIVLSVDSVSGDFSWYTNGEISGVGSKQTYFLNEIDTYDIWVVGENNLGCKHTDSLQVIVNQNRPLGISKVNKTLLFPNPAYERVQIRSDEKIKSVTLQDLSGKIILEQLGISDLNVSHMKPGIYLVLIHLQNGNLETFRLAVKPKNK